MGTVSIVLESAEALDEPSFIIEVIGPDSKPIYYVTLAVWEYDAAKAEPGVEAEGCQTVADFFNARRRDNSVKLEGFRLPDGVSVATLGIGTRPKVVPVPPPRPGPLSSRS